MVQLTDLHLKAKRGRRTRGVDPWATLEAALASVVKERPALVVITGDVAADPTVETYGLLRDLLADQAPGARILPGNHDRRDRLRDAFGMPTTRRTVNFVETLGGFKLIGLDTLQPWRTSGRLGEDQLRWLEAELTRGVEPALLFMHHPPVPVGTWWLDRDLLRDVGRLRDIVGQSGRVRAILCGHVHQEHHARLDGVDVWTTPSTAYQFKPHALVPARLEDSAPGFRVLDLEGQTVTTHVPRLRA